MMDNYEFLIEIYKYLLFPEIFEIIRGSILLKKGIILKLVWMKIIILIIDKDFLLKNYGLRLSIKNSVVFFF